jgi:hypothetical protein
VKANRVFKHLLHLWYSASERCLQGWLRVGGAKVRVTRPTHAQFSCQVEINFELRSALRRRLSQFARAVFLMPSPDSNANEALLPKVIKKLNVSSVTHHLSQRLEQQT